MTSDKDENVESCSRLLKYVGASLADMDECIIGEQGPGERLVSMNPYINSVYIGMVMLFLAFTSTAKNCNT